MRFSTKSQAVTVFNADGLVVGVTENNVQNENVAAMNKVLGGHIKKAIKAEQFKGKAGQVLSLNTLGSAKAGRLVLVGLGAEKEISMDVVRRASAKATSAMLAAGVKSFGTTLASTALNNIAANALAQAVAESIVLASYSFDKLKSEKNEKKIESVILLFEKGSDGEKIQKGADRGQKLGDAACFARDLINLPSNYATPTYLATQAQKMAKGKLKCKTLGPAAIKKLGMGGLVGVSKGSHEPARFIILEYMNGPKGKKPIVLVGKGITFDTGGISLKPSANMEEMKMDMSGAAAVLGTMKAASELNLKANLVALVPSTENMPGGSSYKPGDVLTGLSGVTMEILNTDAEGRVILSDALAYADRYNPDCVVDLATLTGACAVALGNYASGLFGTDEELIEQIRQAGEVTGERCWPMPLWADYENEIKSSVADTQNIGQRWGGAITAAAFLKKHIKGNKWAHVDIAGTAYTGKPRHYLSKGGLGIGVRLMVEFVERRAKLKKSWV